jgi:probable F420-dependent oxidoreductase
MKFDATIFIDDLKAIPALAQEIEALGFDALWIPETTHSPLAALVLAGQATTRLKLGTAIAVAFARSPVLMAYESWDLAQITDSRFMLGLGTQIKPHITRRFGMDWASPGPRMREYVNVVRATWNTFQTNERLNFRGDHYKVTFMTPFFQPSPLKNPDIPIYLAAVGPYLCQVAGEVCDGLHVHSFHTVDYLKRVMLPNIEKGLAISGRTRADISLHSSVFAVTNDQDKVLAKSQIAFYASTPAYREVLEIHGWGDLQEELTSMTRRGQWTEMHELISDDMLATFAVVAEPGEIGAAVRERYEGLLDRVSFYLPFVPGERQELWKTALAAFQ